MLTRPACKLQAMLNANILDLTLPLPELLVGRFPALDTTAARARLTKTLEWSLHSCLLDHIFSRRFVVRRAFLDDEVALSHRFVWAGLIHVALVPFVAAFMTMHFFLLRAQETQTPFPVEFKGTDAFFAIFLIVSRFS